MSLKELLGQFQGKVLTRTRDGKTLTPVRFTFGTGGGFVKRKGVFFHDKDGNKMFLDFYSDDFSVSE